MKKDKKKERKSNKLKSNYRDKEMQKCETKKKMKKNYR